MSAATLDNCPYILNPILQIRPNGLVSYNEIHWINGRPPRRASYQNVVKNWFGNTSTEPDKPDKPYSGDMTAGSKRRIKKAVQLLIASSVWKSAINPKTGKAFKFRVNFITLTLPAAQGNISDSEIKKECLEPWLRQMRNKFKMKNYIWKAERQANGNIHFHITADVFVPYYSIRDSWNNQLAKLGFIDSFKEKHGHRNPNSTDVHSVQDIENLPGYLMKYMAKESDGLKPIEGKMWDCSLNLKTKIKCEVVPDESDQKYWKTMEATFSDKLIDERYVKMICLNENELNSTLPTKLYDKYHHFLNAVRTHEILEWKRDDSMERLRNRPLTYTVKPRPNYKTLQRFKWYRLSQAKKMAARAENSNKALFFDRVNEYLSGKRFKT
jgi:hypothetical protein